MLRRALGCAAVLGMVVAVGMVVAGCSAGARSGARSGAAAGVPDLAGPAAVAGVPRSLPSGALRPRAVVQPGGATSQATWSPDGTLLATANTPIFFGAGDSTIRLWRRNDTLAASLTGHQCAVMKLAWSPDSRTLASASCDGTVRLWRRDGRPVRTIRPKAGPVLAVAWSPDGTLLATGSVRNPTGNKVHVWDVATGTLVRTLGTRYSTGTFYNLAWSPDGRFIVGGAIDYREWDAHDGRLTFDDTGCATCTAAQGFAWSPDSTRWATGDANGDVSVYRTDGRIVAQVTNADGPVNTLGWSPDGQFLAGANTIWRMWETQALTKATLVPPMPSASLPAAGSPAARSTTAATFVPRNRVVALTWSATNDELAITFATTPDVYVFGAEGTRLATLTGHRGTVSWLDWSPDGVSLASGSTDKTIRIWGPAI